MPFRTLAELADMTQDQLLGGIIDSLKKNDQWTAALIANAEVTDRPGIKFNRLVDAGSADYVECDTEVTAESIETAPINRQLLTILRRFTTCEVGETQYSTFSDVVASELSGAIKAVSEKIAADAMIGNGTTALAGLNTENVNVFPVMGSAIGPGDLDLLYDSVLSRENLVYVGAPAVIREVLAGIRAESGGLTHDALMGTEFRVPSYLGVPILRNEFTPAGKLFLVDLNQFKLTVGETAGANVGGVFNLKDLGVDPKLPLLNNWAVYVNAQTALYDLQGAAAIDKNIS